MADSLTVTYLTRLNVPSAAPSLSHLVELQRAHVLRIPYETLWMHQGCAWAIEPEASFMRVASTGRAGYCFHLNGALAILLGRLGYNVTLHAGAVHREAEADEGALGNHLALHVHDLPDESNTAGSWYVDVGLGNGPLAPIPLQPGIYHHGGLSYELRTNDAHGTSFTLIDDPAGDFHHMTWRTEPVSIDRFASHHAFISTSPESSLRQVPMIQLRTPESTRSLRGRTLREIGATGSLRLLDDVDDLRATLSNSFGLDPTTFGPDDLALVWEQCQEAHNAWTAQRDCPD